jgi:hypothetical protein
MGFIYRLHPGWTRNGNASAGQPWCASHGVCLGPLAIMDSVRTGASKLQTPIGRCMLLVRFVALRTNGSLPHSANCQHDLPVLLNATRLNGVSQRGSGSARDGSHVADNYAKPEVVDSDITYQARGVPAKGDVLIGPPFSALLIPFSG